MAGKSKLAIFAWSMYDFANTIFSMNVITLYFALWVTIEMKGADILYSWVLSGSMLLSALTAPILGAVSDRTGRRKPFLIIFTILACLFTAFISFTNQLLFGLLFFAVANYSYQVADVFYNSLLPTVSDAENTGKISGYGVSLGYFGTIVGLMLVSPFVANSTRQAAFLPTAIFFLLFALPCFFFVKETKKITTSISTFHETVKKAFIQIHETFINIKAYSGLLRYLISIFISLNAINTIFIFMSVYSKKVIGFSDFEITLFYIISSVFAIVGSFCIGYITDKYGAKRTLSWVLSLWCVAITLAIVSCSQTLFWIIGPLAGISLGGTWTSARAVVVSLTPNELMGEIFGFYGLVGKTASIAGPLVWGLSVWGFGSLGIYKYRIAVFILLLFLILGLIILQKVPNRVMKHG